MNLKFATSVVALLVFSGIVKAQTATFSHFTYSGKDTRFDKQIDNKNQYFNPIVAGFYPDPSICRKGDTYYLVNSSFSFFPGVPIFTSKDLVNWTQIGNVLDRQSQLPLGDQWVSGGIYAPSISYNKHNDTFYMITTNVGKGTFYVKSKDPARGWSEPIYLPKVESIDPSFCFDEKGKAYIVHNAQVQGGADYGGQTAIHIFPFDVKGDSVIGNGKQIIRGGTHVVEKPIWIEGPHLYKIGKYYYLMCAEGGTAEGHSEVIFRAKDPMGTWEEAPNNPILTQRDVADANRTDKVTSTGHADMLQTPQGDWWAVFLGCRPYEGDLYNTGRETFLLPVTWKDGWPTVLPHATPLPAVVNKPNLQPIDNKITGNFTYTDFFKDNKLSPQWIFLRNPLPFYRFTNDGINIDALPVSITELKSPAAIFRRQQHTRFSVETSLRFNPRSNHDLAGLTVFQNETHNFVFGKTLINNKPYLVLTRDEKNHILIASAPINSDTNAPITLRITGDGRFYSFYFSEQNGEWQTLAQGVDAVNLSTNHAGGFIGTVIGMYATSANQTEF